MLCNQKKTELQKAYKSAEKEVADLNRKLANIKQYIHQEQTQNKVKAKSQSRVCNMVRASSTELASTSKHNYSNCS